MGVLETNFDRVISLKPGQTRFFQRKPLWVSASCGLGQREFSSRKGLTSFAVEKRERERERAVAKSFDTESGGWGRNSIEGGGFDTIRVAGCHKILNGTLGLANLERIVLPLGCRAPRTVATARYRTTRRSN